MVVLMRVLKTFTFFLILNSCSTSILPEQEKATQYKLGSLNSDWELQKNIENDSGSDAVYLHKNNGHLIAMNSVCNKYRDATLESLLKQLIVPMQKPEMVEKSNVMIAEREGLQARVKGSVDGVPVDSLFTVLRKNECLFDFTLSAKNKISPESLQEMKTFLEGFRYE